MNDTKVISARPRVGAKGVGIFLILESLLLFVPLVVLGAAIDWPASLSEPASVVLPQVVERSAGVTFGYFVYLIYSVLFFPMAYLTIAYLEGGAIRSHAGWIGIGFAAISTMSRTIGIARWLTAMPGLARLWMDAPGRDIEIAYESLNALAGGLGEIIGVGLFAGIWALAASRAILKYRMLPGWSGWVGLIASLSAMVPTGELLGREMGIFITIGTTMLNTWWLIMGTILVIRRPQHTTRQQST